MLRHVVDSTAESFYSDNISHPDPNKIVINGYSGWAPVLVIVNHDNRNLYLMMVLYGSNETGPDWHFVYNILYKDNRVNISGGSYGVPLEITFSNNFIHAGCHIKSLSKNIYWKKTLKVKWMKLNDPAAAIATEKKKLLNIFKHIMFFSNKIYKYFIKRRIIICLDKLIFL